MLGDPGAGKTTMLRWIATAYLLRLKGEPEWKDLPDVVTLPDENWLPIIIRCRDLDESCLNGALDDFLCFTLRKAEMTDTECAALRQLLPQKMKDGEALLLLDGLDEITDPADRARFCRQIEQICIAYPQAPIIATSRIVGYREMGYRLGRGFEHVTVADFSKEEKDDFARRWCTVIGSPERRAKAIEDLIQDIHSNDRIERLTGNPMLLTTMALVKRKVGKLPSRRADLYWEVIQVLLNWRQEVDDPIDHREAIPQLEYIAYAMCDRGVQQLREDEILDLLYQMRQEYPQIHQLKDRTPEAFLRLLERRTGIIIEAGHVRYAGQPVPVFEFRHLTLQEYLAGKALVDGRFPNRNRDLSLADSVKPLAGRMSEVPALDDGLTGKNELAVTENWREALRLCVATCSDDDVDGLLKAILTPLKEEDNRATVRPRTIMAVLCLADEPNASNEIAELILQRFTDQIAEEDGWFPSRAGNIHLAAKELTNSIWGDSLKTLLLKKYVEQDSPDRDNYGSFYGFIYAPTLPVEEESFFDYFEQYLLQILSCEEEETLAAIFIINQAVFNLIIRGTFYYSIFYKNLPTKALVNKLQDILVTKPSTALAAAATRLLRFLQLPLPRRKLWQPEEQELSKFIELIENPSTDAGVIASLVGILGGEKGTEVTQLLIAKLNDANEGVQQATVNALGEIKDVRAVEPLIAKLNDANEGVQQAAANALGKIKDVRAVERLIAKLNDANESVQQAAANALGEIKDVRAVEPLIAKLDDANEGVQQAAANALGKIKDVRAVEPLIAKLDDADEGVQQAAANALGKIKDVRAVERLIAKLDDADEGVQQAAANALGKIKDVRAVERLIAKLDDANESVQQAAAYILGEIKDVRAVERLIAKLDDADEGVQQAAANALGEIKDVRAVERLIVKLDDADEGVQQAAAYALGKIEDVRAVERLIVKLDDANEGVQQAAAYALGKIKDVRAVERLIVKLDDANKGVQQVAAYALGKIKDVRAVERLIVKLDDADEGVQQAFTEALILLGNEQTIKKQFELLADNQCDTRITALQALSHLCKDEIDRKLLSRDLDALAPFLDPQEEIGESNIQKATTILELPLEEVIARYKALAQKFSLKLKIG